jgi:hypothetical protein
MAIDYGLEDSGLENEFGFAPEAAPQMGEVLMAKVTVETIESPADYSGVPITTTVTEEIPLPPGPAPMMMPQPPPPMAAPPQMAMDGISGMGVPALPPQGIVPPQVMPPGAPMPGHGSTGMGAQAAQQVMQQFQQFG